MPVTVKLNYLRISPRKVRMVADLLRRKTVNEAENLLNFTVKKAAEPIKKLLKSGVATAENDFKLDKSNLYISKIFVGEGPTLKRWRPRARGRIFPIMKRTSHVTLILDEIEKGKKIKKEIKKTAGVMKKKKVKKTKIRPEEKQKIPKPLIREKFQKMFRRKAF